MWRVEAREVAREKRIDQFPTLTDISNIFDEVGRCSALGGEGRVGLGGVPIPTRPSLVLSSKILATGRKIDTRQSFEKMLRVISRV